MEVQRRFGGRKRVCIWKITRGGTDSSVKVREGCREGLPRGLRRPGSWASAIFKDKRVRNYTREELGVRSLQTDLKKGSMSVKHSPPAAFVFLMMSMCACTREVFPV